jgi:hypothetical protein
MAGIAWELFVVGLLVYGLVVLVVAAVTGRGRVGTIDCPDRNDAPIFVTRRFGREKTATVTTPSGTVERWEY